MKTTLIGWLFFALVSSSMAHEWSFKHESMMPPKKRFAVDDILKNLAGDISEPGVNMGVEATNKLVNNGPVYYCCSGNIIAFSCGDKAIIIDVSLSLMILCDRTLGVGIGINLITNDCCIMNSVWTGTITIDVFITGCSLPPYFANPTNTPFNCLQPPSNVISIIINIVVCISPELYIQIMANQNACITIIVSVCVQIVTLITVNLLGLLILASALIIIVGGLLAFLAILLGIQDLIVTCGVQLQTLISATILLTISLIIGCSDGIQALVYILGICGALINIAVVFATVLNNIALLLRVCVNLGGNILIGVNGVIQVLAVILLFCGGFITLYACLVIIVRVCCCITAVVSITVSVNALLTCLAPWQSVLVTLFLFFNALLAGTCVFASINISAIVALIVVAVVGTVVLIVSIVVFVTACLIVTISVFWCTLLRVFLFLTGSVLGRICLNVLLNLGLSEDPIVVCVNVLGLITIVQVLAFLLVGVFFTLINIVLLNIIVQALDGAIPGTSLSACLNDPSALSESNLIRTWLTQQGC